MKKNNLLTFLFLLIATLIVRAQTYINVDSLNSHNAFKVGEKLLYSVKYQLIKGGQASLTLDLMQNGEDFVYYARAEAYTTGAARAITKVNDTYESYFDLFTDLPVRATRTIQENHYWYYNDVIFDQDSGYVWSLKSGKKQVPTPILDLLSAFYYARRNLFSTDLHDNQIITLNIYMEDHVLPLQIKFKKIKKIRTKFGRINALLFVPVLDNLHTNLVRKEDDLQIWFSDDGNYIPVKILYKSKFGRIRVILIDFQNLNYPFGVHYTHMKVKTKSKSKFKL